ncbi:MAG: hypothetical protein A2147_05900 [Chloroflexi bacterium RBG_16_57_8]|nr:MAG: hypothetical protein A2147_05900 [Chloroflexi bacterium RBG_16_57_8]
MGRFFPEEKPSQKKELTDMSRTNVLERILVPLDGSRSSAKALPCAIEAAKRFWAQIVLLHVVRPSPIGAPASPAGSTIISPSTIQVIVESAKKLDRHKAYRATRYLRAQSRRITAAGVECPYRIRLGEPAEEIIQFCQSEAMGLVVMTTSGKAGVKRALLGSVADRVVREPGFPVLVIRPGMERHTSVTRLTEDVRSEPSLPIRRLGKSDIVC